MASQVGRWVFVNHEIWLLSSQSMLILKQVSFIQDLATFLSFVMMEVVAA